MLNIIIADDEELERRAIKSIILGRFKNEFNIYEAKNGREAIELGDRIKPDIVVMDIKMPGINGIEAIKEIRKTVREAYFMVLTAYDHFAYAKEAIQYDVKEYILKPLKREEFIKKLEQAVEHVLNAKSRRKDEMLLKEKVYSMMPMLQNELCYALINNRLSSINYKTYLEYMEMDFNSGYCMLIALKEKYDYEKLAQVERTEVKSSVRDYAHELVLESNNVISSSLFAEEIVMFIEVKDELREKGQLDQQGKKFEHGKQDIQNKQYDYQNRLDSIALAKRIAENIRNKYNISATIGIGRVYKGIEEQSKSYNEANLSLRYKAIDMKVKHYEDVYSHKLTADVYSSIDMEKQLIERIYEGNVAESKRVFEDMINQALDKGMNMNEVKQLCFQIILTSILSTNENKNMDITSVISAKELLNDSCSSISDIKHLGNSTINSLVNNMASSNCENQKQLINKSINYIKDKFNKDITLEEVANFVSVSPYYFSKIFKEVSGKNYVDYLTEYRIEVAKDMLNRGLKSVKEICFEVGYNDPNYFSRVFKKVEGLSPTEYKLRFAMQQ